MGSALVLNIYTVDVLIFVDCTRYVWTVLKHIGVSLSCAQFMKYSNIIYKINNKSVVSTNVVQICWRVSTPDGATAPLVRIFFSYDSIGQNSYFIN